MLPLFDFKCSRWPPSATRLCREDALQRKLLSLLQRVAPSDGELLDAYFARKRRLAANLANRRGKWSDRHVCRCMDWSAHLGRERNADCWPAILLKHHDYQWLCTVRALREQDSLLGTGTRTSPGRPQARWEEALFRAQL